MAPAGQISRAWGPTRAGSAWAAHEGSIIILVAWHHGGSNGSIERKSASWTEAGAAARASRERSVCARAASRSTASTSHPLAHSILVLLPGAAQPSTTRSDALGRSATGGKQEALSCRMSAPLRTICCSCSSQPTGSTSSAGTWRSIQNVAGGGPQDYRGLMTEVDLGEGVPL